MQRAAGDAVHQQGHRDDGEARAKAQPHLHPGEAARDLGPETARAHARLHPGAPGAIKSLGLADEILAEARARLPVQSLGSLADLNARLAEADTAIDFARRGFNEAVLEYQAR